MIIYLAAPFFSLAERDFNAEFAQALERNTFPSHVVLPQNHAVSLDELMSGRNKSANQSMYAFAVEAIDQCDAVIAILDGADADPGTCVELGYARGKGKTIVGIRTDFRQSEDRGLNLMVSNICSHLIVKPCTAITLDALAEEVATLLASTLRVEKVAVAFRVPATFS